MSIRLAQWLPNKTSFDSKDNTLNVLRFLLEKQPFAKTQPSVSDPLSYCAAHYDSEATQIELVARLMWGAVPAHQQLTNENHKLAEWLKQGVNGTSGSPWKQPKNYDQMIVEMSAFAVAMVDASEIYWEPLTDKEKQNFADWMKPVQELEIPTNNWRWFRVLIVTALQKLGFDIDQSKLDDDLAFIDAHYLGQGWYQDGAAPVLDYYNPFAFHFYGLTYARWVQDSDPQASQKYVKRAVEFAETYQYWYTTDGAQLCYGRSLNYRFAGAAFWSELASFEPAGIEMSLLKSMWTNSMRWWSEQPIWAHDGHLLPGFAYPNLLASEFYTSPVSPFLALKAFNCLRLDASHPFWQANVEPIDSSLAPKLVCDQHLLWREEGCYLISNAPASGELRHCHDKYSKFAYSSDHGLCVESEKWIDQGFAGDNMLAFLHPFTNTWHTRTRNIESWREGDALMSVWQPFEGCTVTTEQYLDEERIEHRKHVIKSDIELSYLMTGHAVDQWKPWFSHTDETYSRVESSKLYSEIQLVQGEGKSAVYPCAPNTNLLYAHASVPAVSGKVNKGSSTLKALVLAGRTAFVPESG
ncbi:conserved hypothetical protein [Vibrio nigripulchritudo MADA3029]|uniref:DUF2264 domain-containing protein n=1 Tax=Vibrio nigripulchritudo TaxID=28173 RepID=UPI0003B23F4C|nr:DUF2264 domain-containing protein [Vibrio nigripulchritudo]CCN47463.1 conserved hypothetical protein [Vibrio nigripulchritudo MADA3020]CCN55869.1 conserved hypothetical protein [Vibrio nigripulchritudo MADA3021]CCN57093.1 conserved hypothetical protein [Vibrio nigripulchritudo MADA3029]